MKRLVVLIVMVVTGLSLVGCDTLPTDVDDGNEENLSQEAFEVLIDNYLTDYVDASISTATFADTYFGVEMGNRFIMKREYDLADDVTFELVSTKILDTNLFEVTYVETKGEEQYTRVREIRTEVQNNKQYLFDVSDEDCDDDGVVACPADELIHEDEVTTFIKTYYEDYLDLDISDQAFADMYMGGEFEDDWTQTRSSAIRNDITVTVKEIYLNDNNEFAAEIEYQDGDDLVLRKRPGRTKYSNITLERGYVLDEAMDTSLVLDQDIGKRMIEDFIEDFQNQTISNDVLLRTYFGGDLDGDGYGDLVLTREEDISSGLTIDVDTIMPYTTFGRFNVKVILSQGEQEVTKELSFIIKEIDKSTPYIYKIGDFDTLDCDDDDDGILTCSEEDTLDKDAVSDFVDTYYDDYLNPDLSNSDFYSMYMGGEFEDNWEETRQMHITNDITISVKQIYLNDNGEFAAEVEYQDGDDLILRKRPGRAKYGDITLKKGYVFNPDIDPATVLDETYAKDLVSQFFTDYQNADIADDELFRDYFNDDTYYSLMLNRQEDLRNGLTITIEEDTPYITFGLFTIHLTLSQGDQEETRELNFMVKELDKATPYLYPVTPSSDHDCDIINTSCKVVTDSAEVLNTMKEYLMMYTDQTVTDDMLKSDVTGEIILGEDRDMVFADDISVTLGDTARPLEDDFFLVQVQFNHPDGVIHRDIAVRVYITDSGFYIREDIPFDASFFSLQ